MTRATAHRGPDGEGTFIEGPVGLGHRRLSVLDLSEAGRQPLADDTGRYHVTFNGAIYNFVELRQELEAAGHRFGSNTDTEVLLHAFRAWGPDCLRRFNGMFAFAVWDSLERTLFCARDRFGVKPFFYLDSPGRFVFGSEVKQLLAARGVPRRRNAGRLAAFLANGTTDDTEETFFEGIRQLRPGHWLVADAHGLRIRRWWTLPAPPEDPHAAYTPEHAREVLVLLRDAVRLRLRSDVPVGSCLSGGVDSNAVLCLLGELLRERPGAGPLPSFTAVFDDPRLDESRYHEAGRARAGAEWHSVRCTGDAVREALPVVVRAHDEPFVSTGPIAQYLVNRLARSHGVTVLLNGQGADEIFGGYFTFLAPLLVDLARSGRLGELRRALALVRTHHPKAWRGLGAAMARAVAGPAVKRMGAPLRRAQAPRWMTPAMRAALPPPRVAAGPAASAMYRAHEASIEGTALPAYLRHEDRNAMACSIESRLPFLDYRLVDRALTLPNAAKIADGWTKRVLRDALRDVVPAVILERRDKMGFPTPERAWLRRELADAVATALRPEALRRAELYDPSAVARLAQRWRGGDDSVAAAVWRVTCVDQWMRAYNL